MFTELPPRQTPGEPCRRWFTSDSMDLVVWLDRNDELQAFQLCYGKPLQEKALTWKAEAGFSHLWVDDGSAEGMGHKSTPVLQEDGEPDLSQLLPLLGAAEAGLPAHIAQAMRQRLDTYVGALNAR